MNSASTAPESTSEPSGRRAPAPPATRFGRRAAVGLAALVALGAAWWGLRDRGAATAAASVKPDVPSVDGKSIVFSSAFRERAGLAFESVAMAPLVPRLAVVGTVDFDPAYVAAVGARIPGLVRRLTKVEGDFVEQGDVLAEIESADLGEAQANLTVANAHRAAAETNERRERDLANRGLTTAREREVATATHEAQRALLDAARQRVVAMTGGSAAPLGTLLLRAPLAGTIVERSVHAGQSVDSHHVAFRVANLDYLWVDLAVFESSLDAIRKGDEVELRRSGAPDEAILGRVAYVGEVVDPVSRTAEVRVAFENRARKLRPGQSVTAAIRTSGPSRTMLTVPITALTYIDGRPTVFRSEGTDRVVAVPVELGPDDGSRQGIVSGISEGQTVVTKGVFALKSELYR